MASNWDETILQSYIANGVQESINLDYKAAGAIDRAEKKKDEITKDVSAMANSAGGIIIYGIQEFNDPNKKYLPEKISPVDRTQFAKEWLEQIIGGIQPRISGIIIHPIDLSSGVNDVAYVVEIPQSTTAHQAKDKRYYKRFNFESVAMYDYEVRDVMHRQTLPDLTLEFGYIQTFTGTETCYLLELTVKNQGVIAIKNYKLHFIFPVYDDRKTRSGDHVNHDNLLGRYDVLIKNGNSYDVTFRSKEILYPQDEVSIGRVFGISYYMDTGAHVNLLSDRAKGEERMLTWMVYADDMPPKQGQVSLSDLYPPR